ncbi:MAG TPA: hypothetical protein VFU94_07860 [Conexibacter sp.]|nr:hypothetical protein [Conexibacter sp.]
MSAEDAVVAVRRALGGRRLVWFGIRGEDGEALLQLPELEASYALTAPLRSGRLAPESNVTLEEIAGARPDLDRFDVDSPPDEHLREFRRRLLREVSGRCVLMTYRPSALVSALAFSMADTMTLAGLFKDRQLAFEHKPWVESSLAARGVRGLGWCYVADEHRARVKRLLAEGPLVLRASRSSGGVGVVPVHTAEQVDGNWPEQSDAFVAAAPLLEPVVPVNFSGCVFADGGVRLHPPSIQLIGIPSCTDRPFGYCGNDFGGVGALGERVLGELDAMGRSIAAWLHEERYRGCFGVDALVHEGRAHFAEINARFQGSSAMSAAVADALGEPDLFVDHLAAMLGLPAAGRGRSLPEWAREQPALTQVVLHNRAGGPLERDRRRPLPAGVRLAQVPGDLSIDAGATLCRLELARSVTQTGFELDAETSALVGELQDVFVPAGAGVPLPG